PGLSGSRLARNATVQRMSESQRDAGLVRAIGPFGLAANIVNVIIGAGIFAVPGALAACIGPYAPLAFVVCAIAVGSVAVCFAEGGSRIPTSGGAYGYVEAAFGPLTGYVAGTLLWLGDVLACGGVAAALADAAVSLLPPQFKAPIHAAVIVGVIGGIALVNVGGVTRGTRLVNLATIVKLVPLVIFVAAGAWAIHGANFVQTVAPTTRGLGRAMLLAMFVVTGMECSLSVSGEVAQPSRTIPRALAMAIGSVVVLYVAIQITAQGILGASLAQSTVPLADAMARISPTLRVLMLAAAAVSMLGWISSDILATPRILFAFARDGMLPRVLGRVHARSHAPHVAILCYAVLAMVLALTGTFAELAVLATLATAVLYMAGSAAAWRLARKGVAEAGAPLNFRWLGTAMVVGIASMLAMIALASRAEIVGLIVVVSASVIVYLAQARYRARKNAVETPTHS
ncbi:MAG: APC family permease, partial [Silvibacterium sp.]